MKKGNAYRKRRGRKPQKKMSTRDLAKRALRKANELDKEEEHKWNDHYIAQARMRSIDNWGVSSTLQLTDIYPLQGPTTLAKGISSYNRRIGAKIHVSGVYLNVQYSWPQITNSVNQRYPPFARIKYAVVLQKKSVLATEGGIGATGSNVVPDPYSVWQNEETIPIPILPTGSQVLPLTTMLFKSMKNGHNYRVLAEGDFTLSAPVARNAEVGELSQPGTVGQPLSQVTTLGETLNCFAENDPPFVTPHQFSTVTAKTIKIRLHPNVTTRFQPLPQGQSVTADYVQPLNNGLYFMTWTDQSGSKARFQPPATAPWTYQTPVYWVNARTRFTDS